jgi:hypothetical protein
MRYSVLAMLVFLASTGVSSAVDAGDRVPAVLVTKFETQCREATGNKWMCRCAARGFRHMIPASDARISHREHLSVGVLHVSPEARELLEPKVAKCLERYPADRSRKKRSTRAVHRVPRQRG